MVRQYLKKKCLPEAVILPLQLSPPLVPQKFQHHSNFLLIISNGYSIKDVTTHSPPNLWMPVATDDDTQKILESEIIGVLIKVFLQTSAKSHTIKTSITPEEV